MSTAQLRIDVEALMRTFSALNECAGALGAADATVEHLVDGVGHERLRAAVTSFAAGSTARRKRLGEATERLAVAVRTTAAEFVRSDEQLAGEAERAGGRGRGR